MEKFKDFGVSRKLSIGFLAMILLILAVGGIGTFRVIHINNVDTYLCEKQTTSANNLIRVCEAVYQGRVDMREVIIESNNPSKVEEYNESCKNNMWTFPDDTEIYRPTITTQASLGLVDTIEKLFNRSYVPAVEKAFELAQAGNQQVTAAALHSAANDTITLFQNMKQLMENWITSTKSTNDSNGQFTTVLTVILVISVVLGVVAGRPFDSRISHMITRPIERIVDATGSIAPGRVDVDPGDLNSKDGIGQLATAFTKMPEGVRKQVIAAEVISKGDSAQAVLLRSEEDTLGLMLGRIKNDLNNMLQMTSVAADRVNIGSEQVFSVTRTPSFGAMGQAAFVEELNASTMNIAQQVSYNAVGVSNVTNYVEQAVKSMSDSHGCMQRLDGATHEIGEDSQQISRTTKLVEDVALQMNTLAPSAAVEAAHASSTRKGFAVIVGEVHNLAAESAEAAKQATNLIQKSVATVSEGERFAAETLKALGEMFEKAQVVDQTIREIKVAPSTQTVMIEQISQRLSQMFVVVQNNVVTAEESSASSEELAAQAQALQEKVSKFRLAGVQGHVSFDAQKRQQTGAAEAEPWFSFQGRGVTTLPRSGGQ